MYKRFQRMKLADRLIILLSGLAVVAVAAFLAFYFVKPAVANIHRGSLTTPQPAPPLSASQIVRGIPISISIPAINRSLSIIPGAEDSHGNWTLTPNNAQYAVISPEPNNHEGNTLIYGHALINVFGTLYTMKKGDIANVTTANGYVFHYKYEGTYAVNPRDWSVFEYKGAPILTLQTCSGTFYQNRQMYQFALLGVEKLKQA